MYLNFFGLRERPFNITPDVSYLYLGRQYEQALDTITYGINERAGMLMLTGEVGTGKTLLSRVLLSRLDDSVATALLVNPLLSVPELLKAINKDFGVPTRINSPQKQIEALNGFLIKLCEKGKNALVVIDEAQNLTFESLEALRMLTNLETDNRKLIQVLLVGQPELLKKLASHELRQLNQRITARYHLEALSKVEMMRYINHRIYVAGGSSGLYFDPSVCRTVYKHSKGYPRLINVICDKALMAAYVRGTKVIDDKSVDLAIADWRGKKPFSPIDLFWKNVFSF